MAINLISAVPGGGKSSYIVWHVIKPAVEAGRIVYTVGIPKLKIPTIVKKYSDISKWHERTCKNPEVFDESDRIYELNNFAEGSLIVIDEAYKLWPAAGRAKASEDIEYLREHRHHGLDIYIVAQTPSYIHSDVLGLVEKHLHITPTWKGRRIYEWSEYCSTPRLKTSKENAVESVYKLPTKAFDLYESASIHTKQSKKIPLKFWASIVAIILAPLMAYLAIDRIKSRVTGENVAKQEEIKEEKEAPKIINHTPQNLTPAPQPEKIAPVTHTLVSDRVDWSKVLTCVSSKKQCICYGHSVEQLVIPDETCRLASKHGFPRVSKSTNL
ncbi:zonular occludens toxin domain-containing protein [Nitrosomonas sp. Nm34]|uniref:zonular occludens toxin domain-containing protein n=1 Tax=Nitrosomonas sp. Nm34 TaxID=1881055 RepID=UPI0008E59FE1|nr:zonular occludens toxin domain-containing protein [Nitrosomonas sp. Nm34]SFJ05074.1 zona occludens toxin [Nitrosomonas sp. Nm34]